MYVTGQLDDTDNFLIDVGTGYYVEKVIIDVTYMFYFWMNLYKRDNYENSCT